jgi:hypothetical protein
MPRKIGICSVIVVLEVAVRLMQALVGGVVIFSCAAALELVPEVSCGEACGCQCV